MGGRTCLLGCAMLGVLGCQEYAFELRAPERAEATRTKELIENLNPTDILFVLDNSPSMVDELDQLRLNIGTFVDALAAQTDSSFQVGIVTTDVDCNVPNRRCPPGPGSSSVGCCAVRELDCSDLDTDADGTADQTDCDGGRLRAFGSQRFLPRPTPGDDAARDAWVSSFNATINGLLGCTAPLAIGSSYEAGLEAARRAVVCSAAVNDPNLSSDCPDPNVADLNAGFIRDDADLAIIFVSDEDDCSVRDATAYFQPLTTSEINQRLHFCNPSECYAHYSPNIAGDSAVFDWVETGWSGPDNDPGDFRCSGFPRTVNPPTLSSIDSILDDIIAAKGGDVRKVRAAAVVGAVPDPSAVLGLRGAGCYEPPGATVDTPPLDTCGCWSTSGLSLFCNVTQENGQPLQRIPDGTSVEFCGPAEAPLAGCESMPGRRYIEFLEAVMSRREAASASADTLGDSLCRPDYESTMFQIVNTVLISNCIALAEVPNSADDLRVVYDPVGSAPAQELDNVEPGSEEDGWSWIPGTSEICLEGELDKNLQDVFEIFARVAP